MALSKDVQAAADTAFDALVASMVSRQAGVKGATGAYRQRSDGASWGTWEAIKPDPAVLPYCRVDEYDSPLGPGYVVVGRCEDSDVTYERTVNVGPDQQFNRDDGWEALEKE